MADTRIDELRRRLEREPGSRLFAQLAEELRKAGEPAEAIRIARAGLADHPGYPSARLTLGRALLDTGEAAGAKVELESALRDAPDNILASRFLAQAREQLGDLKGAVEQYQKTLRMAPGDRQLQGQLAAVEARLRAPSDDAADAETTPPVPRHAPPPLPAGVVAAAVPPVASGRVVTLPSPPRPPVVFAPSPTLARAEASAPPAPEPSGEEAELPPTLRIRSSQLSPAVPARAGEPAGRGVLAGAAPSVPSREAEAPVQVEGEAPAAEPGSTAPFSSSTLAELYYQQGLVDRAVDVYRQLLAQDPGNDRARSRLEELERVEAPSDGRAARRRALERTIAGLESLLGAVRRR